MKATEKTSNNRDESARKLLVARAFVKNHPLLTEADLQTFDALMDIGGDESSITTAPRSVEDYSAHEMLILSSCETKPKMIDHEGDRLAFFLATEEDRLAWNEYAEKAADEFDVSPSLDTYDSHHVFPGSTREGASGSWCPPLWFPEWLAIRRGTEPFIIRNKNIPRRNGLDPVSWYVTFKGETVVTRDFSKNGMLDHALWNKASPGHEIHYVYPETLKSPLPEEVTSALREWHYWTVLNDKVVAEGGTPSDSEIDMEAEAWSTIVRGLSRAREKADA